MRKILKNAAQIVTLNTRGKNYKQGKEQAELCVLDNHAMIIENEIIKDIVPNDSTPYRTNDLIIDLRDKIIFPGFIDCHTHTVFAGSRAGEFRMKIDKYSYEEIAAKGGGINATVKAVRSTSIEDLVYIASERIRHFIAQGVTTLEIKTGYGLDFENEIKMLEVINHLNSIFPIDIIPTFLGAHTIPVDKKEKREEYIEEVIGTMIPYVAKNKLALFCDVFCEKSAFTIEETDRILQKAVESGLAVKLHTDQFNSMGGIDIALKHNAVSIDHLEVIEKENIRKVAESAAAAVLLPGVSYFLNYGYAPARELIDNGAVVALATDYNPGSSNIANIFLIMSLAAIHMRMRIEETISAFTINAAYALNKSETTGSLEIGKKADLAVADYSEYSELVYNTGFNPIYLTMKNGEIIYRKN
jgi:imidazolonepropionase